MCFRVLLNCLPSGLMVIVSWPGVYGSISGSLSDVYYICHTSIIYWGISVGYRSVSDYCPYRHRSMIARYRSSKDLTSDARDTGWSTVGRRTRMGWRWAWSMETSENFNFRISLSNHFLDATLESWPSHDGNVYPVGKQSKKAKNKSPVHRIPNQRSLG